MSKVKITPNQKTGEIINVYKSNKDYGYIILTSSTLVTLNGWVREQVRSTLLRASVPVLEKFMKAFAPSFNVPGRIIMQEFVQSEVPEAIQKQFYNEDLDEEAMIEPYIKRTDKSGPALTLGGERILRFSIYDTNNQYEDVSVQHDNVAEVAAYNLAAKAKDAELPDNKEEVKENAESESK